MMIKGLGLTAAMVVTSVVATTALTGSTASAQNAYGGRGPVDVLEAGNRAKRARPKPDGCNMKIASKLDYNILRVHNNSGMCSSYSRDMYFEYTRGRGGFVEGLDERNDPINYFRYHGIDTAPYEAALVALGFGQHDVRRRTGGAAFSAPGVVGDQAARQAAPVQQPASGEVGACGLGYQNDATRQVQEVSAKNGMCDWYEENVCKKDKAC